MKRACRSHHLALALAVVAAMLSSCWSAHGSGSSKETPSPAAAAPIRTWTTSGYGAVTIWFQNQSADVTLRVHDVELADCVNVYVPSSGRACGIVVPNQRHITLTTLGSGLGRDVYQLTIPARDPTKPMSLHYTFRVDAGVAQN